MLKNTERDDFEIAQDSNSHVAAPLQAEQPKRLYLVRNTYPVEPAKPDKSNQLPAAFTVISRIALPIILGAVAAVITFKISGSQSYVWGAVALGAFIWFALQFAWVDEREKLNSDGEI